MERHVSPKITLTRMAKDTNKEFQAALDSCRNIFVRKLNDYGASWRIMRPCSITDQIFIKAKRIRSIEIKQCTKVGEGVLPEFMAIVNYGIMGLIQLTLPMTDSIDLSPEEATQLYDRFAAETFELMKRKNHDYDEAWRLMRVSSYTDFILCKVERIKEIEHHKGETQVSEGIDSNYFDIINYAIFGVIKLNENL